MSIWFELFLWTVFGRQDLWTSVTGSLPIIFLNIWNCQAEGRGRLCGPDHSTQICSHDQKNQTKPKTTETTTVVCSCFFPTTMAAVELRRRWIDHLQHLRVWRLASGAPRRTARWYLSPLAHGAERTARRLLSPADPEGNQRWRLEIKFLFHLPLYWSAEKGVLSGADWTHLDLLLATVASLKADIFLQTFIYLFILRVLAGSAPQTVAAKSLRKARSFLM